jgi:hypothetical protein
MKKVGLFYIHLKYVTAILYIFAHIVSFGVIWYIFPVLVCCTKTNLATLVSGLIILVPNAEDIFF